MLTHENTHNAHRSREIERDTVVMCTCLVCPFIVLTLYPLKKPENAELSTLNRFSSTSNENLFSTLHVCLRVVCVCVCCVCPLWSQMARKPSEPYKQFIAPLATQTQQQQQQLARQQHKHTSNNTTLPILVKMQNEAATATAAVIAKATSAQKNNSNIRAKHTRIKWYKWAQR